MELAQILLDSFTRSWLECQQPHVSGLGLPMRTALELQPTLCETYHGSESLRSNDARALRA